MLCKEYKHISVQTIYRRKSMNKWTPLLGLVQHFYCNQMEVVILVICTVSQRMFLWIVDPTPFMCQSAKNFVMPCIRVGVGKKNLILQTMGHNPLEIGIDQQMLIYQTPLNTTKYMLYFKMNLMQKWFKTSFNCFPFCTRHIDTIVTTSSCRYNNLKSFWTGSC